MFTASQTHQTATHEHKPGDGHDHGNGAPPTGKPSASANTPPGGGKDDHQHSPGDGHDHGAEPQQHGPNDGHDHSQDGASAAASSGGGNGPSAKRTLFYAKPNQFRATTDNGGFSMVSVSDGKRLSEYTSSAALPGRTYPAPLSITSEQSALLQHPMFCGTLLTRFFGGPDALNRLVDTARGAVTFGPDATVEDEPCKTVFFPVPGRVWLAEVAISTKDGLVRRIRYDSAPLAAHVARARQGQEVPSMRTEEVYKVVIVNEPIPPTTFSTALPKGVQVRADEAGCPHRAACSLRRASDAS
jgi:hypothetical protein